MELVRKERGLVQVIKVAGMKSCLKSCKDNVQRSDFLICSELGYRMNNLIKCCQHIWRSACFAQRILSHRRGGKRQEKSPLRIKEIVCLLKKLLIQYVDGCLFCLK